MLVCSGVYSQSAGQWEYNCTTISVSENFQSIFRGCMPSPSFQSPCWRQTDTGFVELTCICQSDKCNNNSWGMVMGAAIMEDDNQIDHTTDQHHTKSKSINYKTYPDLNGSKVTTAMITYAARTIKTFATRKKRMCTRPTYQTVVNIGARINVYSVVLEIGLILLFNSLA